MSELPNLSAQKPYALDQLAQLQGKIIQLSKSMVLQRARIERCRQSDLAAARDIYAELSRTRETLVETLAQARLFLMEMEEYALAKVSGQLRQGLAGFALMSTGYIHLQSLVLYRGVGRGWEKAFRAVSSHDPS